MYPHSSLATPKRANHFIRFALLISLVGMVFTIYPSFADTSTGTPVATDEICGQRVSNYTYQVPFGDAPWNTPACNLGPFAGNETIAKDYANRLYEYGQAWNATGSNANVSAVAAQKGAWQTQFGLNPSSDYSIPVYHTKDGVTGRKQFLICANAYCLNSNLDLDIPTVKQKYATTGCWDSNDAACYAPATSIPWNDSWKPAAGNDKEMIIIDDATGYSYGLWMVDTTGGSCLGNYLKAMMAQRSPETRLCVAAASTMRDSTGKQANYMTYNGGASQERGMGVANLAMVVTPEEVAAGEIRHALTMEAFNTMTGPTCSDAQLATADYNVIGKTCGYAVSPATTHEWHYASSVAREHPSGDNCAPAANTVANPLTGQTFKQLITLDKQVPEGMRFRLNITDSQITSWLNSRAVTDAKFRDDNNPSKNNMRDVARIFAVALRDYGFIVGDTTCFGASFNVQGVGTIGSASSTAWAAQGITDSSSQSLLDGLVVPNKNSLEALETPVSTCLDGSTTKFYCKWTSSSYARRAGGYTSGTTTTVAPATTTTAVPTTKAPATTTTAPPTTAKPVTTTAPPVTTTTTTTTTTLPPAPVITTTTTTVPVTTTTIKVPATAPPTTTTTVPVTPVTLAPPVTLPSLQSVKVPVDYSQFSLENSLNCSWRTGCHIKLAWPAADAKYKVTSYVLTRTQGKDVKTFTMPATTRTFLDYNVARDTTYSYSVVGVNAANVKSVALTKSRTINCFLGVFCSLGY